MRGRKRTDERDDERAMLPALETARRHWREWEDDALLEQARREAFPERYNSLPFLLEGVPGVTVVLLDDPGDVS